MAFYADPRYLRNEDDSIKHEGLERPQHNSYYKYMGGLFRRSRAANYTVCGRMWLNFELIRPVPLCHKQNYLRPLSLCTQWVAKTLIKLVEYMASVVLLRVQYCDFVSISMCYRKLWIIVGASVGGGLALLALLILVVFCCIAKKNNAANKVHTETAGGKHSTYNNSKVSSYIFSSWSLNTFYFLYPATLKSAGIM